VLWGYEAQDTKNFELIVADDGSRKETYDMLQRIFFSQQDEEGCLPP